MTDQPEKLDLRSQDTADDKRQEILRLFPEIRTEGGKLDFERLKLALGEAVDVAAERRPTVACAEDSPLQGVRWKRVKKSGEMGARAAPSSRRRVTGAGGRVGVEKRWGDGLSYVPRQLGWSIVGTIGNGMNVHCEGAGIGQQQHGRAAPSLRSSMVLSVALFLKPTAWRLSGKLPSPSRRRAGGEVSSRSRVAKGGQIGTDAPHPGPLPEGEGDQFAPFRIAA